MRLGLVGYGVGGRYFHAPFIAATPGIELVGIVARSAAKKHEIANDLPGVAVFDSLTDLLAAGVDAVTISTPPQTRSALVLEAIAAGVHVVADKPFAPTAEAGRELVDAAAAAGVILNVFHNRRWDADLRTVAAVIDSGRLGTIWRVHSRFDLDDAPGLLRGPAGGMLRDLGSHTVDQMIWLLGRVERVSCHLDWTEEADPADRTDAGFVAVLDHVGGAVSYVSSTKLNRLVQREFRVYGSGGSYVASGTDVQAQAIFAGRRPADDPVSWGYDDEAHWGVLRTSDGAEIVASAKGDHGEFYRRFAAAVDNGGDSPVPADAALHTLAVLDAARSAALEKRTVDVLDPEILVSAAN
ncbi:Gfo/Idh/MocA family oxidoreductase [Microbacteriaceae bacterium VKM Ac-2854]|nr:Gfo/Idh/MocA family oxidoreductase [Microbacteriaceae bacterium VKM Ac-2854]